MKVLMVVITGIVLSGMLMCSRKQSSEVAPKVETQTVSTTVQDQPTDTISETGIIDTICCTSDTDVIIAKLLYPNASIVVREDCDMWHIKIQSTASAAELRFLTWSEYQHPGSETQYDEWHRGGIAALRNNTLIDTLMNEDVKISNIVSIDSMHTITMVRESEYHGEVQVDTLSAVFKNGSFIHK